MAVLNEQQLEAVQTIEGPVLILAGAGSGKTHTIIHRVVYLIKHGVPPESILLLTFTNKAANEMKQRAASMLDDRCQLITACTFHSFCAEQLRRYGTKVGLAPGFTVLSQNDVEDVFSLLRAENNLNKIKGFPKPSQLAAMLSKSINQDKPLHKVIVSEYEKAIPFTPEIYALVERYKEYKEASALVDFDDMLVLFLRLLENNGDIRLHIENAYQHIMVDEYQDTNVLQERIVCALRQENRNIAVVGDDAQSIYGFRGSDVRNILGFADKFWGCKTITLSMNYRSSEEIVKFSNQTINENTTENFPKGMTATHISGEKPHIIRVANQLQEARDIAARIKEEIENGTPPAQIAILIRSSFQSNALELELTEAGIPYVKHGGVKFLDKPAIQDYLSFLKIITNPENELAWYRALQVFYGVGQNYAQKIAGLASKEKEELLVKHSFGTHQFADELRKFKDTYDSWKSLSFEELLQHIRSHYESARKEAIRKMRSKEATAKDDARQELEDDMQDIRILIEIAKNYRNAIEFLDAVAFDPDKANTLEDEESSVVISTIHSAKGLEYQTVFIMDCVDGTCPSTTSDEVETPDDNEELRCFYVAVTRAKEHLFMYVPTYMMKFGKSEKSAMSHYLFKIRPLTTMLYL